MEKLHSTETKSGAPEQGSSTKKTLILCLLLLMTTIGVYLRAGTLQFLSLDEIDSVTNNPHVSGGLNGKSIAWAITNVDAFNWHPLTWLSHISVAHFFGMDPGAHHLANVGIHALAAVCLFLFLFRATGAIWRAFFVASLFALHPLHVESVAWVAERKDVLSAAFWFLTLYYYCRYVAEDRKPALYALSLGCFVSGLLCKSMLVTLPVVMILLDFWPLRRFAAQRQESVPLPLVGQAVTLLKEKIPFFAGSLLIGVITVYAQHSGGTTKSLELFPLTLRLQNSLVAYVRYIAKTFWPLDLSVLYPMPLAIPMWQPALALLLLLLITAGTVRARKGHPYLLVGWLWFLVTLVPVIGLIQVGNQAMADRYSYIPVIGLFVMVAWGLPAVTSRLPQQRRVLACLAGAVMLASAALTWHQLGYWMDNLSLFNHALEVTTDNYLIYDQLGTVFVRDKKFDAAIRHYKTALSIAPDFGGGHYNLGVALAEKGALDAAVKEYREALRFLPASIDAHYNLGVAYAEKGDVTAAIEEYKAALSIFPADTRSRINLGRIYVRQGNLEGALREFREILRVHPDDSDAHSNLAMALAATGDSTAAMNEYREAVKLNPENIDARNNLGVMLVNRGEIDAAIKEFKDVVRLRPDDIAAHSNLGVALAKVGALDAAIAEFESVLRIAPTDTFARKNLERALAQKKMM